MAIIVGARSNINSINRIKCYSLNTYVIEKDQPQLVTTSKDYLLERNKPDTSVWQKTGT